MVPLYTETTKSLHSVLGHLHYKPSNAGQINFRPPLYIKTAKKPYSGAIKSMENRTFCG